jgi:hypothetical protein
MYARRSQTGKPGTTGASTALSRQSMHTAPLQRAVFLQMLHFLTSIPASSSLPQAANPARLSATSAVRPVRKKKEQKQKTNIGFFSKFTN